MIPVKEAWISCRNKDFSYYQNLGYDIPMHLNKKGELVKRRKVKFKVKVVDLLESCSVPMPKICDICGESCGDIPFNQIIKSRNNGDGKDYCFTCSRAKASRSQLNNVKSINSIAAKSPNLIEEWNYKLNNKTPEQVSFGSGKLYYWTCKKCKSVYDMSPDKRIVSKRNCPYCAGIRVNHTNCLATTHPELAIEWNTYLNKETSYDITKGNHKKFYWNCSKCGNTFKMSPNVRTSMNCGCPICNESKGEKEIRSVLNNHEVNYISQYVFTDLIGIGGGQLKFDFGVLNFTDKKLEFLIEYDGTFHYEKQYDEDRFETLKIHDERKNIYCKQNNIPLLRIPYWNFENIIQIINSELNKYNLI